MAYETGTVTGRTGLFNKIKDFALANGWTTDRLVANTEWIGHSNHTYPAYVGMLGNATYADTLHVASLGYYDSARSFLLQPGAQLTTSKNTPVVLLWPNSITYWLSVNSNRILCVVKVSTVYEIIYIGRYLPYFAPNQLPLPIAVVGAHSTPSNSYNGTLQTIGSTTSSASAGVGGLVLYSGDLVTQHFIATATPGKIGSDYVLLPIVATNSSYMSTVYGELDGLYKITGYTNAPENTFTLNAENYMVFFTPPTGGDSGYFAMRLN